MRSAEDKRQIAEIDQAIADAQRRIEEQRLEIKRLAAARKDVAVRQMIVHVLFESLKRLKLYRRRVERTVIAFSKPPPAARKLVRRKAKHALLLPLLLPLMV